MNQSRFSFIEIVARKLS